MTIAELKKAISMMDDNSEIMLSNGHAIYKVTEIERHEIADIYGMKCIILENHYMPK